MNAHELFDDAAAVHLCRAIKHRPRPAPSGVRIVRVLLQMYTDKFGVTKKTSVGATYFGVGNFVSNQNARTIVRSLFLVVFI